MPLVDWAHAATTGLRLDWNVGRRDRRPRRDQRRLPLEALVGEIRDVSVSGAAILAPPSELFIGSPVQIDANNLTGKVVVCRIDEGTDPLSDRVLYGVAFLDMPTDLLDHLYQPLYDDPDLDAEIGGVATDTVAEIAEPDQRRPRSLIELNGVERGSEEVRHSRFILDCSIVKE